MAFSKRLFIEKIGDKNKNEMGVTKMSFERH